MNRKSFGALAAICLASALFASSLESEPARPYPAQSPQSIILPAETATRINGPRVTGASPGKPFLFLIPATGDGPLSYEAENLPAGLSLDRQTGIISGALAAEGVTVSRLTVSGPGGEVSRNLVIVGEQNAIALTPPMGWNSWYVWGLSVTDEHMRAAADSFVSTGLAAHGYQYVNIDDGWEKGRALVVKLPGRNLWRKGPESNGRDADGNIESNDKFPDMTALGDYIHARGLKFGIYSSPGPWTCGGYEGSYRHWEQDARTFAGWGVDFYKFDWCSYTEFQGGLLLYNFQKPYIETSAYLRATGRDMVFSLCQYGMAKVWEWGGKVGGHMWRTHGDLQDNWERISSIGFDQDRMAPYARPGNWNDPDMIMAGVLGMPPNLHPTQLTPDEQITQFSLWSLVAAPLIISCDLTRIDPFTLALFSNDEIIAVDQDPLGKAARRRQIQGGAEVWSRPLWDGTIAVGLFNRNDEAAIVTADWEKLGVSGAQPVRDLWRKKDLGDYDGSFAAMVPPHGTVLLRIGRPASEDYQP